MKNNRDHIKQTYKDALLSGKEIIIIPADAMLHSSVFYCTRNEITGRYDKIYAFTRHMGVFRHPLTLDDLLNHILNMIDENARVYIRGAI